MVPATSWLTRIYAPDVLVVNLRTLKCDPEPKELAKSS